MPGSVPETRVFAQVQLCLRNLSSTSGHLAAYHLDPESFEVVDVQPDAAGTAYTFQVTGEIETEFENDHGQERLEGTIVLDEDGQLARDDEGYVRVEPFGCRHPAGWPASDRAELPEGWPEHEPEEDTQAFVDRLLGEDGD